ncbi:MAG: hypothetical protein JKY65_02360 [Planctomycetes bacterium]|nr:hypothetical protein [Planctomycetota bacterium]
MKLLVRRGRQQRCPYCHGGFEDEPIQTCTGCSTQYHLDCAEECVILGCKGELLEGVLVDEPPAPITIRIRPATRQARPTALTNIDVSGHQGHAGRVGAAGAGATGSSSNGGAGQGGNEPANGQRGGTITVRLDQPTPGQVRLSGFRSRDDEAPAEFSEVLDLGQTGDIDLRSRGGAGGAGGQGGDGGAGADGSAGADATRYTSGTRGRRGGNGGRGGRGTRGGGGAQGGQITVEVDPEDTHLLLLVDVDVSGGRGGDPGANGSGGRAGRGGQGGEPHSWTETQSYTDGYGTHQTRTRSRINPGGSRGRSGSPGARGAARVRAGSDGSDGRYEIKTRGAHYSSCYDLRLSGVSHVGANEDGIHEPGERVRVHSLIVRNTGGMPLPQRPIEIQAVASQWIEPMGPPLEAPTGLVPNETTRLSGELQFRIGDYQAERPGAPFGRSCEIALRALLPAVQRDLPEFALDLPPAQARFRIKFPAVVETQASPPTLGPNEVMRIRVSLRNVSQRALGAESAGQRVLALSFSLRENDLGEGAVLLDAEGLPAGPEGVRYSVASLGPSGEQALEVLLAIRPEAPLRESVSVWATLELGYPDEPERTRDVQIVEHVTRVAAGYQTDPEADLLLVVNHTISAAATEVLFAAARNAGYHPAVWDLSLEGHLCLEESGLLDDFAGGALVICDDWIDINATERAQASAFVAPAELRRALAAKIGVAFLGEGLPIAELLLGSASEAPRVEDLLEHVAASDWALAAQAIYTSWRVFGGARETELVKAALRLQDTLRARYPLRRFLLVHTYAPEVFAQAGMIKCWTLGTLEVREISDAASSALVRHDVDRAQFGAALRRIQTDLLLLRPFERSLALFEAELASRGASAGSRDQTSLLSEVITAELALEQRELAHVRWRRGLSSQQLADAALRHVALESAAERWLVGVFPDSPRGQAVIDLLAKIRYFAEANVRWWELLPPFRWLRRRVSVRNATRDLVSRVISSAYKDNEDWSRLIHTLVDDRVEGLHSDRAHASGDPNAADFAVQHLLAPLNEPSRTTSAEVLLCDQARLESGHDRASRLAAEVQDQLERDQLIANAAYGRHLALHPSTTRALLDEGAEPSAESPRAAGQKPPPW